MGWLDRLERHWRWWVLLLWVALAAWLIFQRWAAIRGFGLGDTDDNLRMMQVRALLQGQEWYDLRQYRLNPPYGADVHWSRLVDLPIAGIKLLLTPLIGGRLAEQAAVTIAPLLPMLVAMAALAVTARRLIGRGAFILAIVLIAYAGSARGMWSPLRIDHHGWQLAMLALVVAALSDPKRGRGGVLLGIATALSLAIGLELLLYLALAGGLTVLRWIWDRDQAKRLAAYGVSLAGGSALAFLLFTSYANRAPVCDALSPVWLSAMVAAGAAALVLAMVNPAGRTLRLAAAAAAGAAIAAAFALAWPDCLGRLERSSPELERLWLSKVREAMPVYRHGARTAIMIVTLPLLGLIGYALMLWRSRRDPDRLIPWALIATLALLSAGLLLWQTRAGPAAQTLSLVGVAALVWTFVGWLWARSTAVRIIGLILLVTVGTSLMSGSAATLFPDRVSHYRRQVNLANGRCPTLAALHPIARQPRGTVLTFVDLGPRLITVTHHNAVIGPYHRNGEQIVDVMRTWRGTPENARRTVAKYRIDYVLICPNLSESTIYRAESPDGFYSQLARGRVPGWLQPVPLPAGSPYRMWRVVS